MAPCKVAGKMEITKKNPGQTEETRGHDARDKIFENHRHRAFEFGSEMNKRDDGSQRMAVRRRYVRLPHEG